MFVFISEICITITKYALFKIVPDLKIIKKMYDIIFVLTS